MKIIHTADLHLGQVIYQNYDRNGDDDKQVGHFANGNGFGAIANHAENGKQTKCKANLQFDVFHQENEQKHADTE